MEINMDEAERALDRARIAILEKDSCTFIATVMLGLHERWDHRESLNGQRMTAWTDGVRMGIGARYFMELDAVYRPSLLLHEAWHPALMHTTEELWGPDRMDYKLRNKAGDLRLNVYVKQLGFPIHPTWLYEDKYEGDEWSTLAIYDDLVQRQNAGEKLPDNPLDGDVQYGDSGSGDDNPANDADAPTQEEIQANIEDLMARAAVAEEQKHGHWGNLPGDVQIYLENLLRPKLPWEQVLRNFMTEYQKEDYSMRRPNRRYLPDFFLPTLYNERVANLAYAVDFSWSMKQFEQRVLSEIHFGRTLLNPQQTTVLSFDTRVQTVHELGEYDSLADVKFKGNGGTNIHPVFEHFKDKPPTVLVIFSDLECSPYTKDPGYPVIWVRMGERGFRPEFGEVVQYNEAN